MSLMTRALYLILLCAAISVHALPLRTAALGGWAEEVYTSNTAHIVLRTIIPHEALCVAGFLPHDTLIAVDAHDFTAPGATNILETFRHTLRGNEGYVTCVFMRAESVMTGYIARAATRPLRTLPTPLPDTPVDWRAFFPDTAYAHVTNALISATLARQDSIHLPFAHYVFQRPDLSGAFARQEIADARAAATPRETVFSDTTPHTIWDTFTQDVVRAAAYVQHAWRDFCSNEWQTMAETMVQLTSAFDENYYLQNDTNTARYAAIHTALKNMHRVDFAALDAAYETALRWHAPQALASLSNSVVALFGAQTYTGAVDGVRGTLHAVVPTEFGDILIGGAGRNTYRTDAAVIIDIGGDDAYEMIGARGPEIPFRYIIDMAGNDRYASHTAPGPAGSVCGVAVLIDVQGNDYYSAPRMALGSAWIGHAALIDYAGNDTYLCERYGQGCGFFGTGALYDFDGDDIYIAQRFSQGCGLPGGTGVLYDAAGNDTYIAHLGTPSLYGTPGNYNSFSQGVGTGFRLLAAGGLGMMIDDGGNDTYLAGNFSQGCGYYLGAGILYNAWGNDSYTGSRYTQAAAAHTAVGVLIDDAGDDRYISHFVAGQSLAWDTSVTFFEDRAGDDYYYCEGTGLGAAHRDSMAIWHSGGGADTYHARARAVGYSDASTTNCAVFYAPDSANASWQLEGIEITGPTQYVRGVHGVIVTTPFSSDGE